MSIENPTVESEAGLEKYAQILRTIGSIKYVASPEDPGNPEDKLREIVDYAEQLEAAVKNLKD